MFQKILTVIYIMICALIGIIMTKFGYGVDTIQWWIGCSCVWISFIIGYAKGMRN